MRWLLLGFLVSSTVTAAPLPSGFGECVLEQSKLAAFNGVIAAGSGDGRFAQSMGFADAAGRTPISPQTPFRLASVGKLFTQVAIATLVESGTLRLDDSVRRHLPELPESFAPITLTHLLTHRSGVASMTRPDMADAARMAAASNARDLVPVVAGKPLGFEPGSREEYANGGYLLLGAVIESASGKSYRDYVAASIFAPLGMIASSFNPGPKAAVPMTRMTGPGQPPAATPQPRIEFAALKASSAGDALSSAADLEALALALLSDKFLNAEVKAAVFPRRAGPWRLGQAGGSVGSNTGFWVFPELKSWLIVLSNFDPPAGELMGQTLADLILGQTCKPQAAGRMRLM